MTTDGFAPTDVPDRLAGLGLYVHCRLVHTGQDCEGGSYLSFVRPECRRLGEDGDIQCLRPPPQFGYSCDRLLEKESTVRPGPSEIGVGIDVADVAEAGCTENGIRHGVKDHVRVRM